MKVFSFKSPKGWFVILGMVFLLLALMPPSLQAGSGPRWIQLMPGEEKNPQLSVTQSNFDRVEFEVKVLGMWSEELETKGGVFSQLSIPEYGITNVIGEPKLPVIRKMVQIPYGAEVNVEVISSEVSEKSLSEWGITHRILPVQPPIPKIEGAWEKAEFVIHEDLYQTDQFSPTQVAKTGEIGIIRGHRFAMVEVYPVSYNPKSGRLKLYSDIRIRVNLTGSDKSTTESMLSRYASPPFEELCQDLFINYSTYADLLKGLPALPLGYLIIVHNDFQTQVAPLAEWKTKKGYHVTVANTTQTGTTTTSIKSYIQNAYNNWSIPPTYVLFFGDVGFIPTYTGTASGTATDLYYVKMDGDAFADIFRARLPVRSTTEGTDMVNKILYYENPTSTDPEWMRHDLFIASYDNYQISEGTHRYVIQNYLLPNGDIIDSLWERLGISTAMITSSVTAGKGIVCYSGHGSTTGWASGSYSQSDVRSLTNADKYPFVLSHACLTGQFNQTECFGETWVKVPNKGGIAFWGASNYTYWDEDDILEKRMFQAAFVETCYSVVSMTDKALWYLYNYYGGGGLSLYYLDAYNVLGDPSVDLWTYVADSLFVNYPASIPQGSNTVTVTVQKSGPVPAYGALVCLYKEGEVFETGYTNINGEVTLYPSPAAMGNIDVTVTDHNCLPHQGLMSVTSRVGDANNDGNIDVADMVFILNYLFIGGPPPDPLINGDVDCDGVIDGGDVVFLMNYLFQKGPSPCT